jgi:CAP12/Pycsar effector protein, TIR domain
MSRKSKVFFVSSERAAPIVARLINQLDDLIEAVPWNSTEGLRHSREWLDELLARASDCDFVFVLLTRDDQKFERDKSGEFRKDSQLAPRPNVIFELGLFIGAFRVPNNCFVLSSVHPSQLPSDFYGRKVETFEEPGDLTKTADIDKAIKKGVTAFRGIVEGEPYREKDIFIPADDLMAMEETRNKKAWIRNSAILVRSSQPIESRWKFANIVHKNLVFGIDYHYLFDTRSNYENIGRMLLALAAADVVTREQWEESDAEAELTSLLKNKSERICANIPIIQRRLFISFVPFDAFEAFCIHAAKTGNPKGYLKFSSDRYLAISSADTRAKEAFYNTFLHSKRTAIFDTNPLVQEAIDKDLKECIAEQFPDDCHDEILKACFGEAR